MLRKAAHDGKDPYLGLLDLRSTPIPDLNASPAELLFGRALKTKLPVHAAVVDPSVPERHPRRSPTPGTTTKIVLRSRDCRRERHQSGGRCPSPKERTMVASRGNKCCSLATVLHTRSGWDNTSSKPTTYPPDSRATTNAYHRGLGRRKAPT